MPKLVCVQCQLEYKVKKNGNLVIEMFSDPPEPCKIQNGDRWQCPGCGHEIIAGFAQMALAEHFNNSFPEMLERALQQEDTIYCYEKGKVPM